MDKILRWLPQEEIGNLFLKECENIVANENLFAGFKQNHIFRRVIGNDVLSKDISNILYETIAEDKSIKEKIEKYKSADLVGGPVLYNYPEPFGQISPGTLYFLNILKDLKDKFGDISNFNIVEIGGGHGGQGKIVLDSGVESYSFIDVPETLALCEKYVSSFGYKCDYYTFPNVPKKEFDLCLSLWCLSEFDETGIQFYFDNVIQKCKNGYFRLNIWDERKEFLISLARKYFNVKVEDEYPKTHQNQNWTLILNK